MLNYATPETIIRPRVKGLIEYVENNKDWVMGSSPMKGLRKILQPDSNWLDTAEQIYEDETYEQQTFKTGQDSYWCTIFADNNSDKLIIKRKYGWKFDEDERYVAVGSGTVAYQGNSVSAACEFKRTKGVIKERKNVCDMTWDEGWKPITAEEYAEGKKSLEVYAFHYEMLPRMWNGISHLPYSSDATLIEALKYSPLKVCVDGSYVFDEEGRIGRIIQYNHCVTLLGEHRENGVRKWWIVLDSESKQLLKFVPDYRFGWCVSKDITLINMKMYKKVGESAIYILNEQKDGIFAWTDGSDALGRMVSGGSLYKAMGLSYDLAETVDELPYPVVSYAKCSPSLNGTPIEIKPPQKKWYEFWK